LEALVRQENEGKQEYCERRFLEADTPEDVARIRQELLEEGIPRGTVDTVKGKLEKSGRLPQGGPLVSLKRQFPQRLGHYDVLTPEAVLQELRLQDGDYKVGFVDGIAMLLLAARLNQELAMTQAEAMTPMIKMLQQLREEEREAAEKAKSSSMDIAREAARDAVGGVLGYLDQKIPKSSPPKDMSEMLTKRIDKMWDLMDHMMEQRMFPGYQSGSPPEGWESQNLRAKASSSPAQNAAAEQAQQAKTEAAPAGWETEQKEES